MIAQTQPLEKSKASFAGGINYAVEPYKIAETEVPYLSNARARYNSVETIMRPLLDNNGLQGLTLFQGLYAAGKYALLFADGKAFYKDYDLAGSAWNQIAGFQMSATVSRIHAVLVPASSQNYVRQAGTAANDAVTLTNALSGTPQSIICQDGINQPWLISFDLSARELGTYTSWSVDVPEYVPRGKQMLFYNNILYIVSADGKRIYRSVSGRPLNFMVVIDQNGNKLADEANGGADVVSHAVDFESITCIAPANTPDGEFFVSTLRNSYLVRPNLTSTLFGEPTFDNIALFNTGAVNQVSFTQLLGDAAFVDPSSIRSFNAVLQTQRESRNNPFSARIYPWFQGVTQSDTTAILHDDYGFFSVNSIFGRVVIVYDTLRNVWESIDFWTFARATDYVTQFAEVKSSSGERILLALTQSGPYRAFAGTQRETATIYVGDWTSGQLTIEQKPELLKLLFSETRESGIVYATVFVDNKAVFDVSRPVNETAPQQALPITPPFGATDADLAQVISFDLRNTATGTKVGFLVQWNFNASLDQVDYVAGMRTTRAALQETMENSQAFNDGVPEIHAFTPTSGVTGTIVTIVGNNLTSVQSVWLGEYECNVIEQAITELKFTIPDGATTGYIELRNSSVNVTSNDQLTVA